jgi:DnaJ domain
MRLRCGCCCSYFTNASNVRRDDPYHTLGLEWGATMTEIKDAFRRRAATLHPDVNTSDPAAVAVQKFQKLISAYEALAKVHSSLNILDSDIDEWRFAIWRRGDQIAVNRTDVAGTAKHRPIPPAPTERRRFFSGAQLGHPTRGGVRRGGEFLDDGSSSIEGRGSSSVGRGQNKWVQNVVYKRWDRNNQAASFLDRHEGKVRDKMDDDDDAGRCDEWKHRTDVP